MSRHIRKIDTINKELRQHVRAGKAGRWSHGGGLYFQVAANGAASWALRYSLNGHRRVMTMRSAELPVNETDMATLELEAATHRDELSRGLDPLDQRQAEQQATQIERAAQIYETFEEIARGYIETHQNGWKNPIHRQQWGNTLDQYVYPLLGSKAPHEIETQDILNVLSQVHTGKKKPLIEAIPESASRIRLRMETVLEDIYERQFDQKRHREKWQGWTNPARLTNALKKRFKAARNARGGENGVKHHEALPFDDAPAFTQKLELHNDYSGRALLLTILCATRTSETLKATWAEIDLDAELWVIPAERMKAMREHRIPLSTGAIKLLRNLPRFRHNPYLFPGAKRGKPLSQMAMLEKLRGMKPGSGLTVHGFRSTFRDWISETTVHPDTIAERALAHTNRNKVEAAYRRGEAMARRKILMQQWVDYLEMNESDYSQKWNAFIVKPFAI